MSPKIYNMLINNYSESYNIVNHKYILTSTDDMYRDYSFESMDELNSKVK